MNLNKDQLGNKHHCALVDIDEMFISGFVALKSTCVLSCVAFADVFEHYSQLWQGSMNVPFYLWWANSSFDPHHGCNCDQGTLFHCPIKKEKGLQQWYRDFCKLPLLCLALKSVSLVLPPRHHQLRIMMACLIKARFSRCKVESFRSKMFNLIKEIKRS